MNSMRKWLIMFVAVLGFAAQAQAQDFSIRVGPSLYFVANSVVFGLDGRLYATDVARIAPNINLGIVGSANLIFVGSVAGSVSAGPVVVFSFDRGASFAYAGINLGIAFGGVTAVSFGFVSGVDYALSSSIGLFADISLGVSGGFGGGLDLGVDFGLSRGLDAYVKLNLQFGVGTAFGIGGGLKFAL